MCRFSTDLVHSRSPPSPSANHASHSLISQQQQTSDSSHLTHLIRGTWFGVTKTGRFAFITNVREAQVILNGLSRGFLVTDFLISNDSPESYLRKLSVEADHYTGFNLVVGDLTNGGVWYFGNKSHEGVLQLEDGVVYGLSNGRDLVTGREWWKVKTGVASMEKVLKQWKEPDMEAVQELEEMLEESNPEEKPEAVPVSKDQMNALVESLLDILRDNSHPSTPPATPQTPLETMLMPICIDQHNGYGTRTHTVLVVDEEWNAQMTEVDRYVLEEGVVWTGRETRIVSDCIVETGIDFSEQRRDFDFKIQTDAAFPRDKDRNVIVSEANDE
ncbi:UNVERIFIED_CONTAM: hypothetical protein HDU68_000866 [Siphonaria sp. JEL0065]|nr:hypothetical protein HDU68_000866 [Siphonaria sp. JEL0065]